MQLTKLREDIVSVINNSNLPTDAVYFIMKDIFNEISSIYQEQLAIERQKEMENAQEEEIILIDKED